MIYLEFYVYIGFLISLYAFVFTRTKTTKTKTKVMINQSGRTKTDGSRQVIYRRPEIKDLRNIAIFWPIVIFRLPKLTKNYLDERKGG